MLIQNNFNHIVKASGGYVFRLKSGILFFDGLIHISSDGFICLHIGDTNLRWHHALWLELSKNHEIIFFLQVVAYEVDANFQHFNRK